MRQSHVLLRSFLGKMAGWTAQLFTLASVLLLGKPNEILATPAKVEGDRPIMATQSIDTQVSYIQIGDVNNDDPVPPKPE